MPSTASARWPCHPGIPETSSAPSRQIRSSPRKGAHMRANPPPLDWRKSSHSGGTGNCVELAAQHGSGTAVRDSKDAEGPVLSFRPAEWAAFARAVRAGLYDSPRAAWRRSSRSGQNGNCVEVSRDATYVAFRDSKAPDAGYLTLSAESFAQLVQRAKCGELDI
ncbi:DUF397 domain-containing protein [Actinomadura sp. K4S16]|uniref:DUF397 domain-containing protein n=1 Tax=Actinomadura sp. K4S16 TaxID=1316147 RepID=UPI00280B72F4|nr:DUF397 domain-containing protein [Actinomadura sp. K4S16]